MQSSAEAPHFPGSSVLTVPPVPVTPPVWTPPMFEEPPVDVVPPDTEEPPVVDDPPVVEPLVVFPPVPVAPPVDTPPLPVIPPLAPPAPPFDAGASATVASVFEPSVAFLLSSTDPGASRDAPAPPTPLPLPCFPATAPSLTLRSKPLPKQPTRPTTDEQQRTHRTVRR